jgi:hypothetical protein
LVAAACLSPAGDVNGSGETNIVDVQCGLVTTLWWLAGAPLGGQPSCLSGADPRVRVDANCDGNISVGDVTILILHVLDLPLGVIDANDNACVDGCEVPPPTAADCCDLGGVGCGEASCVTCVCAVDANCCADVWGPECAAVALGACGAESPAGAEACSCGAAEVDPPWSPPAVAQEEGLAALQAASLEPVEHVFDDGVASLLVMRVPLPEAPSAVERGLAFFAEHPELYGLTDPAWTLVPSHIDGDAETFGLRVLQFAHGRPVVGAYLTLSVLNGEARTSLGRYARSVPPPAEPLISAAQAEDAMIAAYSDVEVPNLLSPPALIYFFDAVDGDPPRVVQAWTAPVKGITGYYVLTIDADTGELLLREPMEQTLDFSVDTANYESSDSCWWLSTDNDRWFDEDGQDENYHPDLDLYLDGWEAKNSISLVYDFYLDLFNWRSYDNSMWDSEIEAFVHVADPNTGSPEWLNASWTPFCNIMQFGDSYAVPEILAHEFTHGVIRATAELVYKHQPGAINEAIADIMGAIATGDWAHGDTKEKGGRRHLLYPTVVTPLNTKARASHFSQYVKWPESMDHGGVHEWSSIPALAVGLMVHPEAQAQPPVIPIPPVHPHVAGCLVFEALRYHLGPTSQFKDFAMAMIGAAKVDEGKCGPPQPPTTVCTVTNALFAVGLWPSGDTDCDGVFDVNSADDDGDGVLDAKDNCPIAKNASQIDTDKDGLGDACDPDIDADGKPNGADNCPYVANPTQLDANANQKGDHCEDPDNDGVMLASSTGLSDNCPAAYNPTQSDKDKDSLGDACDADDDNDGVADGEDNCPFVNNPSQADGDGDSVGNACDNCPENSNPGQADCNKDGVGVACTPEGTEAWHQELVCNVNASIKAIGKQDPVTISGLFANKMPIPPCIQCQAIINPNETIEVVVEGLPATGWVGIVDHQQKIAGKMVSYSPDTRTATLFLQPSLAAQFSPAAAGPPLSAVGYELKILDMVGELETMELSIDVKLAP